MQIFFLVGLIIVSVGFVVWSIVRLFVEKNMDFAQYVVELMEEMTEKLGDGEKVVIGVERKNGRIEKVFEFEREEQDSGLRPKY